jgi:hypothetical protein
MWMITTHVGVFAKDWAVFFTTIGSMALSDSQLETLALSLTD